MASSWGLSWGTSWGNSWGPVDAPVPVLDRQPGGGYYRRPIIYLDEHGKPVKLNEHRRPVEEPVEVLPEIPNYLLNALSFPVGPDQRAMLADMLAQAQQRLAAAEYEQMHQAMMRQQEEDDEAVVLLLS